MKGKYMIEISCSDVKYKIEVKRKYTLINDKTGNGKTRLFSLLSSYFDNPEDSDVFIKADYPVYLAESKLATEAVVTRDKGFVFIDEYQFVGSGWFDVISQKASVYFILVARKPLKNLTYSIDEVYEFQRFKKGKIYTYLLKKYFDFGARLDFKPEHIFTEDEQSGYQFFSRAMLDVNVVPCCGRSKVRPVVINSILSGCDKLLIIVDGAACGGNSDDLLAIVHEANIMSRKFCIFLPESFEYLLLMSELFVGAGIKDELEHTYNYVETSEVLSWETYYEGMIRDLVGEGKYIDMKKSYKKEDLPEYFIRNRKYVFKVLIKLIPTDRRFL